MVYLTLCRIMTYLSTPAGASVPPLAPSRPIAQSLSLSGIFEVFRSTQTRLGAEALGSGVGMGRKRRLAHNSAISGTGDGNRVDDAGEADVSGAGKSARLRELREKVRLPRQEGCARWRRGSGSAPLRPRSLRSATAEAGQASGAQRAYSLRRSRVWMWLAASDRSGGASRCAQAGCRGSTAAARDGAPPVPGLVRRAAAKAPGGTWCRLQRPRPGGDCRARAPGAHPHLAGTASPRRWRRTTPASSCSHGTRSPVRTLPQRRAADAALTATPPAAGLEERVGAALETLRAGEGLFRADHVWVRGALTQTSAPPLPRVWPAGHGAALGAISERLLEPFPLLPVPPRPPARARAAPSAGGRGQRRGGRFGGGGERVQ